MPPSRRFTRPSTLGINWIDTAPVYGLGHSEEVVGKAVKESHVKPFIFTKCGMVWNEKREIKRTLLEIRREVEDSLRRLQVEAIDLYQIHWPVEDKDIEEGWIDDGRAAARRQGAAHRRLELLRGPDGALPGDRSHRLAAAALLDDQPRGRGGDSALLPRDTRSASSTTRPCTPAC